MTKPRGHKKNVTNPHTRKKSEARIEKKIERTDLLTVVLCELVEEPASLLGLEISQHGGDDGADVLYGKERKK